MSNSVVIIPTYNEKENIVNIINTVFSLEKEFDVLIIDDNSPDGTGDIVNDLIINKFPERLHLVRRAGKLGLGTAYITGFRWALERDFLFVFEMDADFSHPPHDLVNLYKACNEKGADLAIGSRYISGVNVVNWPMGRVLMSYYASAYVRFVTRMKIKDTTAGFICYSRMKFTAWKYKFNIVEIPIIFTERKEGKSKMSGGIFSEAIWGVIKMKIRSWFKKYPVIQ